jgi:hypothetical protein
MSTERLTGHEKGEDEREEDEVMEMDEDDVMVADDQEVSLDPGAKALHLRLALPRGYKWTEGASHHVTVASQNDDVVHVPPFKVPDLTMDWMVPIEVRSEGRTIITVTGAVFYCPVTDENICMFGPLDLSIPVVVEPGGMDVLEVSYAVTPE